MFASNNAPLLSKVEAEIKDQSLRVLQLHKERFRREMGVHAKVVGCGVGRVGSVKRLKGGMMVF